MSLQKSKNLYYQFTKHKKLHLASNKISFDIILTSENVDILFPKNSILGHQPYCMQVSKRG